MITTRNIFYLLLILCCCACAGPGRLSSAPAEAQADPSPPAAPTELPTAALLPDPALTPTPAPPDTGWLPLRPGLERRAIRLFDESGSQVETLYLVRLEPDLYRFDVHYRPDGPPTLPEWQAETGALLVVNGSYYREEGDTLVPTGLLITRGQATGRSYGGFAGMLAITANGPELRWLEQTPYDPEEPLQAGLQSFPLLVKPGGELGFPEEHEDGQQARRTALGQDRQGRFLFLVAFQGYFTLHQFSLYLVNSDLDLDIVLNLDGGTSSGLLLAEPAEVIPALAPLPIVITVHSR
jgi:hypothetical protein